MSQGAAAKRKGAWEKHFYIFKLGQMKHTFIPSDIWCKLGEHYMKLIGIMRSYN